MLESRERGLIPAHRARLQVRYSNDITPEMTPFKCLEGNRCGGSAAADRSPIWVSVSAGAGESGGLLSNVGAAGHSQCGSDAVAD